MKPLTFQGSAKFMNVWNSTSTPPIYLNGVVLS